MRRSATAYEASVFGVQNFQYLKRNNIFFILLFKRDAIIEKLKTFHSRFSLEAMQQSLHVNETEQPTTNERKLKI